MFFNSWSDIVNVIILAPLSYIALIIILRTSGKRTLSKMNMFDFVITVALGSSFSAQIMSKSVALAEGVTALAMLVLLQYIVATLTRRYRWFQYLLKGQPTLVFYNGYYLPDALKKERLVPEEIRAAARAQGIHDMSELAAVILETNGTFSVLPKLGDGPPHIMGDMQLPDQQTLQRAEPSP